MPGNLAEFVLACTKARIPGRGAFAVIQEGTKEVGETNRQSIHSRLAVIRSSPMTDRLRFALKIAISLALVGWLLSHVDLRQVGAALREVDIAGFALATLLVAMLVGPLSAMRWMVVMHAQGAEMRFPRAFALVLVSWFFNQFIPSGLGGDAMRAWGVKADGTGWEAAIHGVFIDRLLALAAMVVIVALGWPLLSPLLVMPGARAGVAMALAASVAAIALLMLADKMHLEKLLPVLSRVTGVARSCRAVFLSGRAWSALALATSTHLSLGFVVWLLARSLGLELPLLAVLVLMPLVLLVTMVPVSIAGWGVREGVMIIAFGLLGVPAVRAFALSVLFGLSLLLAALPGGLLWLRGAKAKPQSPAT